MSEPTYEGVVVEVDSRDEHGATRVTVVPIPQGDSASYALPILTGFALKLDGRVLHAVGLTGAGRGYARCAASDDGECVYADIADDAATAPDTATAILAGLVETVRVMRQNAYSHGLTELFADYDHALEHLQSAAVYLPPSTADAYTNPVDKIEQQAREV